MSRWTCSKQGKKQNFSMVAAFIKIITLITQQMSSRNRHPLTRSIQRLFPTLITYNSNTFRSSWINREETARSGFIYIRMHTKTNMCKVELDTLFSFSVRVARVKINAARLSTKNETLSLGCCHWQSSEIEIKTTAVGFSSAICSRIYLKWFRWNVGGGFVRLLLFSSIN